MKRFLQLTFTIAFVLCAMLSLSGCSSLQKILPDNMGTRHYWGDDDPWGEETILSKTADSVSFWRRFGLKSGKFVFTGRASKERRFYRGDRLYFCPAARRS